MKIDTRYGSIWDELPASPAKTERRVPQTQEEALDFYEAAESSVHNSLMKTWDSHNDMVKKSAELRRLTERRAAIERQAQEARERQHEMLNESAEKARKRHDL
ncbi:MAG: hypothetical protein IJS28_10050 [Synergistaceae bacterium]|nr:hypothetical protein [Synergistaceae bacterium]